MTFRSRLRSLLFAAAIAVPMLTLAAPKAHAGIFISVNFAPPVLPIYEQPPLPAVGYIWTPGYWAYGDAGYYWVPGVWVEPPTVGLLWTPGYWGWSSGAYVWNVGYWGPHVGFYGGVNYGFGYGGIGFFGGEWRGGAFAYNSACANFGGVHVTNVYVNRTIIQQNTIVNNNHTSFNGPGGINRRPSVQETQFSHESHVQATSNQMQHQTLASQDRAQLATVNHGRPATMASASVNAYHQVAEQHVRTQPISAADRSAGAHPASTPRANTETQRANTNAAPANHPAPARTETQPRTTTPPRTASQPRTESEPRTVTPPRATATQPRPETQPRTVTPPRTATTQPRPEAEPRTVTPPRTASRPDTEAAPRTVTPPRTATSESKPAPAPSKPAPARQTVSRPQPHPAPQARPMEQPRASAPRPREGSKPGGR